MRVDIALVKFPVHLQYFSTVSSKVFFAALPASLSHTASLPKQPVYNFTFLWIVKRKGKISVGLKYRHMTNGSCMLRCFFMVEHFVQSNNLHLDAVHEYIMESRHFD